MRIDDFQKLIEKMYLERDVARGMEGTYMWFIEEVGELATALRKNDVQNLHEEFADVFAWLCTLASVKGVRMEKAIEKYLAGCPGCGQAVCACDVEEKN